MNKTFQAQILTPYGKVFEGEVTGVQVPGSEGKFEMKVNHAPIVSTLDIGSIRIHKADGQIQYFAVSDGFVEMNENKLSVMAESSERVEDIDVERARQARERALEELMRGKKDRKLMESALKRAENRLKLREEKL